MEKKKKSLLGPFCLLLAAFFWGTSFVAQDVANDSVHPFAFNGLRMLLTPLFLLPVILVKNKGKLFASVPTKEAKRKFLLSSVLCGIAIFFAANLQQFGFYYGSSAGKSGFITAMYVVMVPLFGIFLGKKLRPLVWGCVAIAIIGLYLLCMASFDQGWQGLMGNFALSSADLLTLCCALFFSLHIILVDRLGPETDGVLLSCLQFFTGGMLSVIAMCFCGIPTLSEIKAASGGILYSAVFSCSIAYTLQILGQQKTSAVVASILMCLESVFAVLSDMVILKTRLSLEETLGCILMFCAILFSNLTDVLPTRKKSPKDKA